jgi:hypothetical protein
LAIGRNGTGKIQHRALKGVSKIDAKRKLMVVESWSREAAREAARGVAVLVLPQVDVRFER